MIFYVGATFTRYREVRALIDVLESLGHKCAEDWTRTSKDFGSDGELLPSSGTGYEMQDHWAEAAQRERAAVAEVSLNEGFCLFLGEQASLGWPVEMGMSIAFGVPRIIVVSPFKPTVFMALPEIMEVDSQDAALEIIAGWTHQTI